MINSLAVTNQKQKPVVGNIVNDIYLLPQWEIIKTFSLWRQKFLFGKKHLQVNLLRKFSSKNMIEKYSIRTINGGVLANMDLMIYKDSVYVINLELTSGKEINGITEKLLQTAIEKAMYNTTEKEVIINLPKDAHHKNKLKKVLLNSGFTAQDNQSRYEEKMFGKEYKFSSKDNPMWTQVIEKMPLLINK